MDEMKSLLRLTLILYIILTSGTILFAYSDDTRNCKTEGCAKVHSAAEDPKNKWTREFNEDISKTIPAEKSPGIAGTELLTIVQLVRDIFKDLIAGKSESFQVLSLQLMENDDAQNLIWPIIGDIFDSNKYLLNLLDTSLAEKDVDNWSGKQKDASQRLKSAIHSLDKILDGLDCDTESCSNITPQKIMDLIIKYEDPDLKSLFGPIASAASSFPENEKSVETVGLLAEISSRLLAQSKVSDVGKPELTISEHGDTDETRHTTQKSNIGGKVEEEKRKNQEKQSADMFDYFRSMGEDGQFRKNMMSIINDKGLLREWQKSLDKMLFQDEDKVMTNAKSGRSSEKKPGGLNSLKTPTLQELQDVMNSLGDDAKINPEKLQEALLDMLNLPLPTRQDAVQSRIHSESDRKMNLIAEFIRNFVEENDLKVDISTTIKFISSLVQNEDMDIRKSMKNLGAILQYMESVGGNMKTIRATIEPVIAMLKQTDGKGLDSDKLIVVLQAVTNQDTGLEDKVQSSASQNTDKTNQPLGSENMVDTNYREQTRHNKMQKEKATQTKVENHRQENKLRKLKPKFNWAQAVGPMVNMLAGDEGNAVNPQLLAMAGAFLGGMPDAGNDFGAGNQQGGVNWGKLLQLFIMSMGNSEKTTGSKRGGEDEIDWERILKMANLFMHGSQKRKDGLGNSEEGLNWGRLLQTASEFIGDTPEGQKFEGMGFISNLLKNLFSESGEKLMKTLPELMKVNDFSDFMDIVQKYIETNSDPEALFKILRNSDMRQKWLKKFTPTITEWITYICDPDVRASFWNITSVIVNPILQSYGYPIIDVNNASESVIKILNVPLGTYLGVHLYTDVIVKELIDPVAAYLRKMFRLEKDEEFNLKLLSEGEIESKLFTAIDSEVLEPIVKLHSLYQYAVRKPDCAKNLLCLANYAVYKDNGTGVTTVVTKSASLFISWILTKQLSLEAQEYWEMYEAVWQGAQGKDCQAIYKDVCLELQQKAGKMMKLDFYGNDL